MKSIGFIAVAALAMSACTPIPSAQKNGTLVKLAQSGIMFRTWEAELVRGGSYTGGTGVQGAPFDFTIHDDALLTKVRLAFNSQSEVRIKYHQEQPAIFTSDSGGNFLDAIEVIDPREGGTQRGTEGAPVTAAATATTDPVVVELLKQNNRLLTLLEKRKE